MASLERGGCGSVVLGVVVGCGVWWVWGVGGGGKVGAENGGHIN